MAITFKKVPGSAKAAHQTLCDDGTDIGEVWRERVSVVVSKLTEPRRMATKWRWFAKKAGSVAVLGRGDRAAMLLGAGFKTKQDAVTALGKA